MRRRVATRNYRTRARVSAVTARRAPDTGDGGARTTYTYAVRQYISISVLTVTTYLARCHALCVTHVTVGTSYSTTTSVRLTNRTLGARQGPGATRARTLLIEAEPPHGIGRQTTTLHGGAVGAGGRRGPCDGGGRQSV